MKTKRGFLLAEETLKTILAVIALGFLAYLLFSLYSYNRDSKDLELAKESLDFLMQEANAGATQAEIYNPEGWKIYSWPNDYEKGIFIFKENLQGIPESCSNLGWSSCVCICEEANPDSCNEGVCLENNQNFKLENSIEIKPFPITLNINQEAKIITAQ